MLLLVSCLHSNYENVRITKNADGVIFHPDQNAPREPMPFNASALLAHSGGRWGVLYYIPYRETGLGAINRTITTCALYLAVIGEDLAPLTEKPSLVHSEEGNYTIDFSGSDDSFCVSYVTRDNRLECLVYDPSSPEKASRKYSINNAGAVTLAGASYSSMPLAYYREEVYALAVKGDLRCIKVLGNGSIVELPAFRNSGKNPVINSADILVDDAGIHAGWAETESGKGGGTSFYYTSCDHAAEKCVTKKIPVKGDSPHSLNVALEKMNTRVVMMIQHGNDTWMVKYPDVPSKSMKVEKLVAVGTGSYPPVAECACSDEDCLVIFHKVDGAYIYSSKSGLKRSSSPGYIKRAKCRGAKCIQFNSEKGIVPLK